MCNQDDSNNELVRAAAHSYCKISRDLTEPTKVPSTPPVSFDSMKSICQQAYANVESVSAPLNAIAILPAEQQEYMAALERRLNASTKDVRTLLDYEEQRIVVTSTVKETIVYTLLAIPPLAAGVGLNYVSHLGINTISNAAAEVTPR